MNVAIKKVSERDAEERFVLVNATTREVLTVHDVTEAPLRRYFKQQGMSDELFDACLARARARYQKRSDQPAAAVNEASDTIRDDDLLFDLGLGEDDVH